MKKFEKPEVNELEIKWTAKNETISGEIGQGISGTGRCPGCNMPLVSENHKKGCTYSLS